MPYEIVGQMENFEDVVRWISGLGTHVGLIVFGPDSQLKNAAYHRLLCDSGRLFDEIIYRQEHSNTWSRGESVHAESGTIIKLDGYMPSSFREIQNIAINMRNDGMKLVIGIYVKGDRSRESFMEDRPIIKKHDPNANGLDFLILHQSTNPSPLT